MIHRSTYPNPSLHTQSHTHTHTHKHKPSNHQQSHTHTNQQTSWSQQRPPHPPPKPPFKKPKPPIRNPHCQFETQATDQKNHHRSKSIQKKSSLKPPSELPMINPTDPPTDQQIHHFKPTDQLIQTHHQPIPAHWSKPSSPIHVDPTSKIQNPGMAMKLQRWESRWRNREGRERREHK